MSLLNGAELLNEQSLKALVPLVRMFDNGQIMRFLPSLPPPLRRALHIFSSVPGRDSAYYLLNLIRHLDRREDRAWFQRRLRSHFVRPILRSEKARWALRQNARLRGISSLIITPTVQCNLRCTHCYNLYEIHEQRNDHLPEATIDRMIEEGKALGAYRVSFIGGEPLIRWQMIERMVRAHEDVLFTVITNGTLLTEPISKALAQHHNLELSFSVDGFEALHDKMRGEGQWRLTLDAMKMYHDHGGMVMFSPTVTSENYQDILSDEFLALMAERGAYMGYLHHYDLVGGQASVALLLDAKQLAWMQSRIEHIHKQGTMSILSNVLSNLVVGGCPAAREFVHVNHKGDVEPCCMVPFAGMNVESHSLKEILNSKFFQRIIDAEPDEQGIRRCLVGQSSHVLKDALQADEARATTLEGLSVLHHHEAEFATALPTCFCHKPDELG